MKTSILILLLGSNLCFGTIKIMTFNTMCDFCNGSDFSDYDNRLLSLAEIVRSYNPDVFALQEVRTRSQVKKILQYTPHYDFFCTDSWFMSYADPVIVFDKRKFELIKKGQSWLGPSPERLNFGWKWAVPRQFLWVELKRKSNNKSFIFLTSHFDNRIENLAGSAEFINQKYKNVNLPFIFAADTNLTTDTENYARLIENVFINAFDIKSNMSTSIPKEERDLCYLKKGKIFPDCRVDHILLSKNQKWKVSNFTIDQTRNYLGRFPSDHRPVILDLDF